jgi:hypothetical protein
LAERGWLPRFVPTRATHIRSAHDLDTNRNWLTFSAPLPSLDSMTASMERISWDEARKSGVSRPTQAQRGWPFELDANLLATPRADRQIGRYRAVAEPYCVLIERATGRAWAWTCEPGAAPPNAARS